MQLFIAHLFILGLLSLSLAQDEAHLSDLHKRSGSAKAPHHIRDALGEQAIDLIHQHGQNVDLSLDGYDHDLVSRSLAEGSFEPRNFDADIGLGGAQNFGRMQPRDEQAARENLGDDVDYSSEGYDDLYGEEEEIDYSLEGYDHALVARELKKSSFEEADGADVLPRRSTVIKAPPMQVKRSTAERLMRSWSNARLWAGGFLG